MKKNKSKQKFRLKNLSRVLLRKFLIIIFLPFYLFIFRVIKHKEKLSTKILKSLAIFFFVAPLSFTVNLLIVVLLLSILLNVGVMKSPIEVIGESMMPTLRNHQYLFLHPFNNWMFWKPKISRGDIVTFQDDKTEDKSYIKRVIGLPEDELEIRNGFIYINGRIINESYVSRYRSTYGGGFLSECKKIKIPRNNVFVLGDNRIRSSDSREMGFISFSNIDAVLYYGEQNFFNTKPIKESNVDINSTSLNANDYVQTINKLRSENNLQPLELNSQLSKSAKLRAIAMLKFDDLSWEATRSGYPMSRAMGDAGYYNIVYNEYPVLGYYGANDLYNYMMEVENVKDFLLHKDYQDIGIATAIGDLNNCPVQLVVQHIAGYAPPNYTKETIDSWGRIINNIEEILPSWEEMKNWQNVNRNDLDKLLGLLYRRKNNAEAIYYRMKANQWLTSNEEVMVNEDKNLYDQIEALAKKLNGK